jgi:hypothetical protein
MNLNEPGIALGTSDFKKLRQSENSLYVDKSAFIKEILNDKSEVILITRPRRFGKTLNMSMLQYFFDIKDAEENRRLFDGLAISKNSKLMKMQGQRPVIFISFKDCKADNWEKTKELITGLISNAVKNIMSVLPLEQIESFDMEILLRLKNRQAGYAELIRSLFLLTELLAAKDRKNLPLILIDEYDVPLQNAWLKGFWDEASGFLSGFFCATFKDNPYLWKGILSGCLRISKESIFTDLNNIKVCSITTNKYSSYFGLTVKEVKNLLQQYQLKDHFATVKAWYDGYLFGDTFIYNPWSVLSYIDNRPELPKPYWVNTSGNELVHSLLFKADGRVKEKLSVLLRKEAITVNLKEHLVFREIDKNPDNIWNFLFFTGYLKYEKKPVSDNLYLNNRIDLKIPNQELMSIFVESISSWFVTNNSDEILRLIAGSLKAGNGQEFAELFQAMIEQSFSYFDLGEGQAENFYHAFTLGLMVLLADIWQIRSNREAGFGRSDILMFPKKPQEHFGVVLEFKTAKKTETLKSEAESAMQQIIDKNYALELQNAGAKKIIKIGIAFQGRRVEILWE